MRGLIGDSGLTGCISISRRTGGAGAAFRGRTGATERLGRAFRAMLDREIGRGGGGGGRTAADAVADCQRTCCGGAAGGREGAAGRDEDGEEEEEAPAEDNDVAAG